jgi:hypothetical protein
MSIGANHAEVRRGQGSSLLGIQVDVERTKGEIDRLELRTDHAATRIGKLLDEMQSWPDDALSATRDNVNQLIEMRRRKRVQLRKPRMSGGIVEGTNDQYNVALYEVSIDIVFTMASLVDWRGPVEHMQKWAHSAAGKVPKSAIILTMATRPKKAAGDNRSTLNRVKISSSLMRHLHGASKSYQYTEKLWTKFSFILNAKTIHSVRRDHFRTCWLLWTHCRSRPPSKILGGTWPLSDWDQRLWQRYISELTGIRTQRENSAFGLIVKKVGSYDQTSFILFSLTYLQCKTIVMVNT